MGAMRAGEMAAIWHSAKKPRQEICAPLKWLCFLINFAVFLVGVTGLALGIYLCTKDPRPIGEWEDVVFNPAIIIIILGLSVCAVSLCGLFGALRDNVFLLKTYTFCVFCAYILLVISTFALFMLFYSESTESGVSAHSILLYTLKKYHLNRNVAEFVDYVQEQLECCGTSSSAQGFRDWQLNEQFQCNQSNPYPERCGVPFSCCRKSVAANAVSELNGGGVALSDAGSASNANSLSSAIRSLRCWQNAQTKSESDLDVDIYTRGCMQPLRAIFEKYAMHFGAAVAAVILPVCLGVCLTQCLARQIDYQRYLLDREARRHERRKRRELRYAEQQYAKRKQQQAAQQINNRKASCDNNNNNINLMEQGRSGQVIGRKNSTTAAECNTVLAKKSPPPNFPPPPTPRDEPNATDLAAALAASRRQWHEDEERRRQKRRAVSTSPMRQHRTGQPANTRNGAKLRGGAQTLEGRGERGADGHRQRQQKTNGRDGVSARRRVSAQLSASATANAIQMGAAGGATEPPVAVVTPSAPPLHSYASQQYLLKQSDFS